MPIFWADLPADDRPSTTVITTAVSPKATQPSRWADILTQLTTGPGLTPLIQRTCEVGVDRLEVTGAGLSLIGGAHHLSLHTTDALAHDLGEVQAALGQVRIWKRSGPGTRCSSRTSTATSPRRGPPTSTTPGRGGCRPSSASRSTPGASSSDHSISTAASPGH